MVLRRSDSTSATLTYLFYELAKHPEEVTKLRDELTTHLDGGTDLSNSSVRDLNHLNGIINETLRLYAVAPAGLSRLTPPEGIEIDDTFIPGNMTITCPQYVMGRSMFTLLYSSPAAILKLTRALSAGEKIYTDAKEFIPERWYSKPELIKDRTAFAPFSIGR